MSTALTPGASVSGSETHIPLSDRPRLPASSPRPSPRRRDASSPRSAAGTWPPCARPPEAPRWKVPEGATEHPLFRQKPESGFLRGCFVSFSGAAVFVPGGERCLFLDVGLIQVPARPSPAYGRQIKGLPVCHQIEEPGPVPSTATAGREKPEEKDREEREINRGRE